MKIDKTFITIFIVVLISVISFVLLLDIMMEERESSKTNYENEMVETCENLGLELLDYSKGSWFKDKKINCFNKITKEVITIE